MRLEDIDEKNRLAISFARKYRQTITSENKGVINQEFHKNKNQFPYFGFIDAEVAGEKFVMFSSNDDLVAMTFFWHGHESYEPMSMALWVERARRAKTILDVGSFSGVYSLSAATANQKAHVYAIEAARRTYGRLLVNTQINMLEKQIKCTNVAVAAEEGTETFLRFRGENILGIGDSFIPKSLEVLGSEEKVRTVSLDAFCAERSIQPDLIKIDVEGAECLVLSGMENILAQSRPEMIIEVTRETCAEVGAVLENANYSIQIVNERNMALQPFVGKVDRVLNFLATPRDLPLNCHPT